MKNFKSVAVAAVLAILVPLAAYATAEALGNVDFFAETKPAQFVKGIYIGPRVGTTRPTVDTLNKVTAFRVCSTTFDFPAVAATNTSSATAQTAVESWAVTCTGAKLGDKGEATSNFGQDGGAVLPVYVQPRCRVTAADQIKFALVGNLNDGGTYDATDAGYFCYLESFQPQ